MRILAYSFIIFLDMTIQQKFLAIQNEVQYFFSRLVLLKKERDEILKKYQDRVMQESRRQLKKEIV